MVLNDGLRIVHGLSWSEVVRRVHEDLRGVPVRRSEGTCEPRDVVAEDEAGQLRGELGKATVVLVGSRSEAGPLAIASTMGWSAASGAVPR